MSYKREKKIPALLQRWLSGSSNEEQVIVLFKTEGERNRAFQELRDRITNYLFNSVGKSVADETLPMSSIFRVMESVLEYSIPMPIDAIDKGNGNIVVCCGKDRRSTTVNKPIEYGTPMPIGQHLRWYVKAGLGGTVKITEAGKASRFYEEKHDD